MATVELVDLRKAYSGHEVLHGIGLDIAQGEFLALVGPSGCGKSTLLRMIAGLETITSGEVRFDGTAMNTIDPKRRNVAMVFQNYALYPHMTVAENISLNLRISRVPRAEIDRRVSETARLLEIEPILMRRPSELSGGQRQRVAMGRALVRDPAVFLFDEPLSNLDAKLRVQMRAEIKALHQKVRTTSIYVTHDQIEAMTLADRIAVMHAGRIEQIGSPVELYAKPANRFVGTFIGSPSMNIIEATVRGRRAEFAGAPSGIALPEEASVDDGQKVALGLRPEHLRLSEQPVFNAIVRQVEPTGSQTHVGAELGGQMIVVVLEGMVSLSLGQTIGLNIEPEQVQLFSADTGQTLRMSRSAMAGGAVG